MEQLLVSGVTQEMQDITDAKFAKWDKIVGDDVLSVGTLEEQTRVYELLQDYTIYAYAFLKDPRNSDNPLKLYAYQDIIINDQHKRVVFAAANQIGKSICLCVKALIFALNNPGTTTLMTSRTETQSKDLIRQIKSFLRNSSLSSENDIGETETKTELYIRHFEYKTAYDADLDKTFTKKVYLKESRIICTPATEAALGYAVDLALEDELFFYENGEHFHNQILQPRTYTTKGQIIIFSNPNGQQGIGWKVWNDPFYHRYRFNFLDCPTNTQEEYDILCRTLTREQIDSTLLAIFTSPEGGFLTLDERKDMQEERSSILPSVITQPIYIFFDWAKVGDRTVRIIGVPLKKNENDWADVVYIYSMKEFPAGTKYTDIIDSDDEPDSLKNLVKMIGPQNIALVGWDNTGVGKGLEDFVNRIEQLGVQCMPVEFSLQNKSRIYTLFKLLAENRRIKMPTVEECNKQLSMLRFKTTARGLLQVHHENERDRDDFPDAIAGLCSLIIQPEVAPVTCEII